MPSPLEHSGRYGVVNGQSSIRTWSVNETSTPAKHVSSSTKWGTGRRKGIKAWSGSFGAFGGVPLVMPGEFFDFKGYTAPDNDISGDGVTCEGRAVMDSIAITWNWTNAEIISLVANFSGHLALTIGSDEYSDAGVPDQPSTLLALPPAFQIGIGAETPWSCVSQMALNISCANTQYVNADTTGWTGRKTGPAVDWTLAVTEQKVKRAGLPEIGDDMILKLYVNATQFWHLKWGHLKDYSNLTVNRETGEVLSRVANLEMSGFDDAGAAGLIQLPGAVAAWWPA